MFGIRKKMANTAKRAGLLTGGLLLCAVGAWFLTLAAWFALLPLVGLPITAVIIASVYLGIGLILIGVGLQGRAATPDELHAPPPPPVTPPQNPPMMEAFLYGIQAGAKADRARRKTD